MRRYFYLLPVLALFFWGCQNATAPGNKGIPGANIDYSFKWKYVRAAFQSSWDNSTQKWKDRKIISLTYYDGIPDHNERQFDFVMGKGWIPFSDLNTVIVNNDYSGLQPWDSTAYLYKANGFLQEIINYYHVKGVEYVWNKTTYTTDPNNRLISTDQRNRDSTFWITEYEYGTNNLASKRINQDRSGIKLTTNIQQDSTGNLKEMKLIYDDGTENMQKYFYEKGRLSSDILYDKNGAVLGEHQYTWTGNLLTKMVYTYFSYTQETTYEYDSQNRLAVEYKSYINQVNTIKYKIDYSYIERND